MAVGEARSKTPTGSPEVSAYDVASLPAPAPPIHVHVDTTTPVHVHIRKTKKDANARDEAIESPLKARTGPLKSPKYPLPPHEPYQPDPELGKEMNDLIQEYINKCSQDMSRQQCYPKRKMSTPRQQPQCDKEQCQTDFLARSLNVLRNQGKTSCQERSTAGQDKRHSLEQLNQLEKDINNLSKILTDVQVVMKDYQETTDTDEAGRKKDSLMQKLSQMDTLFKTMRHSLGMPDGANGDLVLRLETAERRNEEMQCELREQENIVDSLRRQVQCEKDYNQSLRRLQAELEETRCNLQRELLNKSTEIERTTIQMKNLQNQMGEHLQEVEHLQTYVDQTTRRNECEKVAMKKALKLQLDRATRCEEDLQKSMAKIGFLEDESKKTRQDAKQMEAELEKLRPEAQSKVELEAVCERLKDDLKQLQPLPELLATTEQKFKEEQTKCKQYETRVSEQAQLIAEISSKIEGNNDSVRKMGEQMNQLKMENHDLLTKMNSLESNQKTDQSTITELNAALQMKNEIINQLNCKLEDRDCSNLNINRQLEEALAESNRLSRMVEERAVQLEKQNLGRVKDLEAQLACGKQEIKQLKQDKQDLECKYGRQMTDLKEKLEQCDTATHNMQSYISYLKTAYASVFNDPNLTIMCPPMTTKDTLSS